MEERLDQPLDLVDSWAALKWACGTFSRWFEPLRAGPPGVRHDETWQRASDLLASTHLL